MSSTKPVNSNPPDHPPFAPHYCHISTAPLSPSSKIISFAGQIGYDPVTKQTPPDLASQVVIALSNLEKCLQAASATKEDIIQVRQYVVGISKLSLEEKTTRAGLYSDFMGSNRPPATLIGVESLATAELLYEIEVVAIVNN